MLSFKARKRIAKAIDWMLCVAVEKKVFQKSTKKKFSFKVAFVTLTLASPQVHSDQVIKSELLNQFLTEARQKWSVRFYMWRAEAQQNGNIHFHVLVDRYIHYKNLQSTWNRIQNKLGYVDRFREKWGSGEPNSTDVHSVKLIKNLSAYLSKYCTKQDENRKIDGKIWGLSTTLSQLKPLQIVQSDEVKDSLSAMYTKYSERVKESLYFDVWFVKYWDWCQEFKNTLFDQFYNYIKQIRSLNNNYSLKLFTT